MRWVRAVLCVLFAGAFVAECIQDSDARPPGRRGGRGRGAPPFYQPKYDDAGNEILPTDPEERAKSVIWARDSNRDRKLSPQEAAIARKDFEDVDSNRDGFLDVKEIAAAYAKFVRAAGGSAPKSSDTPRKGDRKKK
jgi:hypothetical protein